MSKEPFLDVIGNKKSAILSYLQNLWVAVAQIQNEEMLLQTFVHKSFAADYKDLWHHNERLEFVGDGILWAIINKQLFINNPEMPESELTLYKIALVREEILAEVARDIDLASVLMVSNGEERSQGRKKDSILSDALEALIWFLYIELGIEEAEKFVITYVYSKLASVSQNPVKSYKTMVQEQVQKEFKIIPEYKDLEDQVDEKWNVLSYKSELMIDGKKVGEWFGTNKKKAQEEVAKLYYLKINI